MCFLRLYYLSLTGHFIRGFSLSVCPSSQLVVLIFRFCFHGLGSSGRWKFRDCWRSGRHVVSRNTSINTLLCNHLSHSPARLLLLFCRVLLNTKIYFNHFVNSQDNRRDPCPTAARDRTLLPSFSRARVSPRGFCQEQFPVCSFRLWSTANPQPLARQGWVCLSKEATGGGGKCHLGPFLSTKPKAECSGEAAPV